MWLTIEVTLVVSLKAKLFLYKFDQYTFGKRFYIYFECLSG